jgi:hypothetical protein
MSATANYLPPDYGAALRQNSLRLNEADRVLSETKEEITRLHLLLDQERERRAKVEALEKKYPVMDRIKLHDRLQRYRNLVETDASNTSLVEATEAYFQKLEEENAATREKLARLRAALAQRSSEFAQAQRLLGDLEQIINAITPNLQISQFRKFNQIEPAVLYRLKKVRLYAPEIAQAQKRAAELREEIARLQPRDSKLSFVSSPKRISFRPVGVMARASSFQSAKIGQATADGKTVLQRITQSFDKRFPALPRSESRPKRLSKRHLKLARFIERKPVTEAMKDDIPKIRELSQKALLVEDVPEILRLKTDRSRLLSELEAKQAERDEQAKRHNREIRDRQTTIDVRKRVVDMRLKDA